jgi:AcrR family transcriptional regulator
MTGKKTARARAKPVRVRAAKSAPAPRRPGRPSADEPERANRASILRAGLKLTRSVALQDLSIVGLARSLDITPALVHYYLGSREQLTSGIINLFYKGAVRKWPEQTGDWHQDVVSASEHLYGQLLAHPGIAAYLVQKNEFRVVQATEGEDIDYGLQLLELFIGTIRSVGLSPERTSIYTHMMREFLFSTAHRATFELFPSQQREELEKTMAKLSPEKWPNVTFPQQSLLEIDGDRVFHEGIELFLLGMERDRSNERMKAAKVRRK